MSAISSTLRVDVQLHPSHNFFTRYTHDRNSTFAILGPLSLPSGWSRRVNQADQVIAGLTSVLSPRIVNDLRLAYFSTPVDITPATRTTAPTVLVWEQLEPLFRMRGVGSLRHCRRVSLDGRRLQLTENLVWQKGNHSLRAGFDWEHNESRGVIVAPPSGEITVFSPSVVRQEAPRFRCRLLSRRSKTFCSFRCAVSPSQLARGLFSGGISATSV